MENEPKMTKWFQIEREGDSIDPEIQDLNDLYKRKKIYDQIRIADRHVQKVTKFLKKLNIDKYIEVDSKGLIFLVPFETLSYNT